MSPINYDSFKSIYDLVFALSFLIISYLQVLLSKFIKSNHYCFSIYSFHAFLCQIVANLTQAQKRYERIA